MKRSELAAALAGLLIVAITSVWWFREPEMAPALPISELPQPCRDLDFEGSGYVVCEIDVRRYEVGLFRLGPDGKPFGSLSAFDKARSVEGKAALLAMNAGMYHADLTPVGLFASRGKVEAPLNLADGAGNFFMKPNGVFFINRQGQAAVMETTAFHAAKPDVAEATQSGPMLVIDGQIHPRFEENGASRFIRNGVGLRDADTVVLAISRSEVSLGSFARLFRDALGCANALFFDGDISALSNGKETIVGGDFPAGPIIAVSAKNEAPGS
jgi:uncharacterized protein YigE (DUF2233 family)